MAVSDSTVCHVRPGERTPAFATGLGDLNITRPQVRLESAALAASQNVSVRDPLIVAEYVTQVPKTECR
jgi:hypothetical protein